SAKGGVGWWSGRDLAGTFSQAVSCDDVQARRLRSRLRRRSAHGFRILCVDRTQPGESGPRASSAVTLFSRTQTVKRAPSVLPCSISSTRAGLPFKTATSFAAVYSHQSPVPRLFGWVSTTFFCATVFSISLESFAR